MFILQRLYRHPPTPVQAFVNARRVMPLIGAFYGVGKCRLLPGFDPCRGLAAAEMPSSTGLLSQQGHYDEGYG